MRVHTGEKSFARDPSGNSFKYNETPNSHTKSEHSGENGFMCHQCGESFSCKVSLYTHVRLHTTEKAFTCELCGDSSRNGNLKSHENSHSREAFSVERVSDISLFFFFKSRVVLLIHYYKVT